MSAGVQGGGRGDGEEGGSDSEEEVRITRNDSSVSLFVQESATEQFLKDLMVQREQREMEKGGERVGVGKFQQAGLEENKSLHMKTTTTAGLCSFSNASSSLPLSV